MRTTWTRERIIRHILRREADGRPLTTGGEGVDLQLYSAARRIFGSWRNTILAAGIPPERVLTWERWSPGRILAQIRLVSRRRRPLSAQQLDRRYGNLVSAARRHFGSWTRAVLAAGVDPARLRRVVPWNRERVIEAILTRALRGDSLAARMVEPRSLVEAAQRFFGSWYAAVRAAGLDLSVTDLPPRGAERARQGKGRMVTATSARGPRAPWSKERVIEGIRDRVRERRRTNAQAVSREDPRLYSAARRHLVSWHEAMRAAGVDAGEHRRGRSKVPRASATATGKSQSDEVVRPTGGA